MLSSLAAPCPPQNISAVVNCSSNDMMISWDAFRGGDNVLVSVSADSGSITQSCSSAALCTISNLTCGEMLSIQVTSVRGSCLSQPSQTLSVRSGTKFCKTNHHVEESVHPSPATKLSLDLYFSAPCQPQEITGYLDCVTNSAWISWDAAAGADSYSVAALSGQGYTGNCSTSSNSTCEVEDLECGVLYSFTVTAENSQCDSQPSSSIDLQTGARRLLT